MLSIASLRLLYNSVMSVVFKSNVPVHRKYCLCQFMRHWPDLYNVVDWQIFLQIVVDLRKIAVD